MIKEILDQLNNTSLKNEDNSMCFKTKNMEFKVYIRKTYVQIFG